MVAIRWIKRTRFLPITDSGVKLGSYSVASVLKGPIVLLDGRRIAVIYVPSSPYNGGEIERFGHGAACWAHGKQRCRLLPVSWQRSGLSHSD